MSAKLKFFLAFTLGIFGTAVLAGVYTIKQWHSSQLSIARKQQQIQAKQISTQNIIVNAYSFQYKTIPLKRFTTSLKGTDPTALAVNAFDPNHLKNLDRKVEVVYPQPNQAMVTITQTDIAASKPKPIKHRVKLTSFGRSLFLTSPPLWQIVWAGTSEQCLADATSMVTSTVCH